MINHVHLILQPSVLDTFEFEVTTTEETILVVHCSSWNQPNRSYKLISIQGQHIDENQYVVLLKAYLKGRE